MTPVFKFFCAAIFAFWAWGTFIAGAHGAIHIFLLVSIYASATGLLSEYAEMKRNRTRGPQYPLLLASPPSIQYSMPFGIAIPQNETWDQSELPHQSTSISGMASSSTEKRELHGHELWDDTVITWLHFPQSPSLNKKPHMTRETKPTWITIVQNVEETVEEIGLGSALRLAFARVWQRAAWQHAQQMWLQGRAAEIDPIKWRSYRFKCGSTSATQDCRLNDSAQDSKPDHPRKKIFKRLAPTKFHAMKWRATYLDPPPAIA